MTRWWMLGIGLAGCPTAEELSWTIAPAEGLVTVRMHDVRSDDGSEDDWVLAAGLLTAVPGAELVDGLVRYEEVDGGLDVSATLRLDEVGLAGLVARASEVGLWCGDGAILRTNGHDLTPVLGTPCVAWPPGAAVYELTVDGGATDGQPSVIEHWRAAGAPTAVAGGEEDHPLRR